MKRAWGNPLKPGWVVMGLFMMVFIVVPQVSKTLIRVQRVQVTHPTMTRDSCCSPLLFGRRKSPCRAISPSCMLLTSRKSPEFYQEVVIRTQVLFCAIETRPNTPVSLRPKAACLHISSPRLRHAYCHVSAGKQSGACLTANPLPVLFGVLDP